MQLLDQRTRKAEIHLTYRCDLDCPGCNRGCFNKRNLPPDLTKQTFVHTLDEIERLGFTKTLVIIGGEPTLHRECVDFLRIGHSRGFAQSIWSNAYSPLAKTKIGIIREEGTATVVEGTHKLNGAVSGFYNPYIFCSPVDMGVTRNPCKWGTLCGYSVDEASCTPCPIGGMIAHYTARQTLVPLEQLLNQDYLDTVYQDLCKHCGSFLPGDPCWKKADQSKIVEVNGTKMTKTWMEIFKCTGS